MGEVMEIMDAQSENVSKIGRHYSCKMVLTNISG